jgi:uncharacterized protein
VTRAGIVNIPVEALSDDALLGVIDDYINREGTDYGMHDTDLAQKRAAVRRALASGRAIITYDPDSRTTTLVAREALPRS